jgi:hypothetical protein
VGDLAGRVHAGVGAPGHRQVHVVAEHRGQGQLELALDGPQRGLPRPAVQRRPVVGDLEPNADEPATGNGGGLVDVRVVQWSTYFGSGADSPPGA